ncbi:MAG: WXG100 family type VII secretion target [Propionibacteriaceae bacterium]|jgi:WXG100 family type VII secretion target|nr:WXG100 family type VII secretion target [Propionibacteriaceae bacterium]
MANIHVGYEELRTAATHLRTNKDNIQGELDALKSYIQNLVASGFVTDQASKQFESTYTQFTEGARQTIEALQGLGQYLDQAAAAFSDLDTQLSSAIAGR